MARRLRQSKHPALGPMNGKQISEHLHSGVKVFGTLVVANSPRWLTIIDQLGIDFVFIDTEHVALDRLTLAWMCQGYAAKGVPPVVRITRPDPYEASMALDGGACGIIAPYVETAAQVRDLVGAVKYKPLKGQRLQRVLEEPGELEPELRDYLASANADRVLIVNIESTPAIENLDAILQVEGLDAVLVGPHDLSCSLGIPEHYEHPRFCEAIDTIIRKARAHGVGAGVHACAPILTRQQGHWAGQGANLMIHSADILAVAEKLGDDLKALRAELGSRVDRLKREAINI